MINNIDIKELIDRVENLVANQKVVERKVLDDYLRDKQEKGLFHDNIITFEDADDYALFEKLSSNLGYDLADILMGI